MICHFVRAIDEEKIEYPLYGKPIEITDAPYTAAIYVLEFYECLGSYIKEYWILTSGYCIVTRVAKDVTVVMGTNKINDIAQKRNVTRLIVHPGYVAVPLKNDIGILWIESPFKIGKSVKIIPIGNKPLNIKQTCFLVGWGLGVNRSNDLFYDTEPILLRKVEIQPIETKQCKKSLKKELERYGKDLIDEKVFCAKGNACIEDIGAALICEDTQVGIASMIIRECGNGAPSLYSNLFEFKPWIDVSSIPELAGASGCLLGSSKYSVYFLTSIVHVVAASSMLFPSAKPWASANSVYGCAQ
ncbi:hypothetical protein Trydic_g23515 [Trypoxylus dichotomus]